MRVFGSARFVRFLTLVLWLFAHSTGGIAQNVTVKPLLKTGDRFALEVFRSREDSARPQQNSRVRTVVDIEVVSATPTGITLDWIPGESTVEGSQALDPLVTASAQALQGIRFRLSLNGDGEMEGVANEAQVAPRLQAALVPIVDRLASQLPAAQSKAFRDVIAQVLTPSVLVASAVRDAGIYLGLNGVSLSPAEAVAFDMEQPNPFGAGSVKARFQTRLNSVTEDSASLQTSTRYASEVLLQMMRSITQQVGSLIPDEELRKLPPLQMGDDGSYVLDRRTGLMRTITINRVVAIGNTRRVERWEIRRLSEPQQ